MMCALMGRYQDVCMSVGVSKRVCVCAFKPMIKCMLYDSILCEQNGHHCE